MKKVIINCMILCLLGTNLSGKLAENKQLTLSVIIPCHYKHAQYLYSLIESYEKQTVLPNEIVISLSESHKTDKSIINKIENKDWKFPVILLKTERQAFAGENRNMACKAAHGDILATQDADDLPHPQRTEIVKYFFQNYDIYHLMHQYTRSENKQKLSIADIQYKFAKNWPDTTHSMGNKNMLTAGNIAISYHIFKHIQWPSIPREQDVEFNKKFFQKFDTGIVIFTPLIQYRQYLSTAPIHE